MKLILLGAPGAGKGTQAEVISQHLGIPTISTGNIIREALKSGSEMGRKAKTLKSRTRPSPGVYRVAVSAPAAGPPTMSTIKSRRWKGSATAARTPLFSARMISQTPCRSV